jgi:hypothetical protein
MRVPTALAALFAAAVVAQAAPPDVPKTLIAKPGQLVRVVVKTDAPLGTARNFEEADAFWGELVGPKGERHFVFQAPDDLTAGRQYVVTFWVKGETEGATTTVSVPAAKRQDEKKDDRPDDKKDDAKPPPGKVESVRLVVVSESANQTARKAEFYGDKSLQDYWQARKWDGPWWVDPQAEDPATKQTPAKWKPFVDQAKSLGLAEAVFVVDRTSGKVLYEGKPPATPADLLKLLKDKTGG